MLCKECDRWIHKRCSGLQSVAHARDYVCPTCTRRRHGGTAIPQSDEIVVGPAVNDVVEEVETFCYLGSVVDREGGVERAVRARVASAWTKWREISGLLCNRRIPLKNRAHIYEACIRPVILYGAESWPLTQRLEKCIQCCDRRMLRILTGVSLRDRVSSAEVARRCGLREILEVVRVRRLQWFGHVQRRRDDEALSVVRNWQVEGRRPRGRPKKTWMKMIEEDLRVMEITEDLAYDRQSWREAINRPTPQTGNTRR